jgi:hypothetical protein
MLIKEISSIESDLPTADNSQRRQKTTAVKYKPRLPKQQKAKTGDSADSR